MRGRKFRAATEQHAENAKAGLFRCELNYHLARDGTIEGVEIAESQIAEIAEEQSFAEGARVAAGFAGYMNREKCRSQASCGACVNACDLDFSRFMPRVARATRSCRR